MHLLDALNALATVMGDDAPSGDCIVHYDRIPDGRGLGRDLAACWQLKNVPADAYGRWKWDMQFFVSQDIWVLDGLKMMSEAKRIGPDIFYTVTMKRDDI